MSDYGQFIDGKPVVGTSGREADLFWPMTGEGKGSVALAWVSELRAAVRERATRSRPGAR